MTSIICRCNSVDEAEILAAIRAGAGKLSEIGERCEAGTGCGSCHEALLAILEEEAKQKLQDGQGASFRRQLDLFGS